jgi:hypothetical protein
MEKLKANKQLDELDRRAKHIGSTKIWTQDTHDKFEKIDRDFTNLLLNTEKACKNNSENPWSLILHVARQTYRYWRTVSKGKANRINTSKQLEKQMATASDPDAIWQGDRLRPSKNQLKRSIQNLAKVEAHAWDHRRNFLIIKHSMYKGQNEKKKAKIVQSILRAERKTRCYSTCQNINNPRSANGGLTHVLTPDGNSMIRINSRNEVEQVLHKKNQLHFAQAKHTPCANGEIADMLTTDGVSKTTQQILNNQEIINVPKEMSELFAELKKKRGTLSDHIPFNDMINGFHKWREKTTTSPSGKHLGIY